MRKKYVAADLNKLSILKKNRWISPANYLFIVILWHDHDAQKAANTRKIYTRLRIKIIISTAQSKGWNIPSAREPECV